MTTALQPLPGPFRNVLRGAERDAAVAAAAEWYREQEPGNRSLSAMADKFGISLTAAGEARLRAEHIREGGADGSPK
jgi:hypothetical protein